MELRGFERWSSWLGAFRSKAASRGTPALWLRFEAQMRDMNVDPFADELRGKVGDGVNQAADLISATASIPSLNFIPLTTFGNVGFDLAFVER